MLNLESKSSARGHKIESKGLINQIIGKSIKEAIPRGIRCIYVVGSVSTFEETILLQDNNNLPQSFMSDIDIFIDVDAAALVRCYFANIAEILSKTLNEVLKSSGFKTHVSISITSLKLSRFAGFLRPNTVYLFELTPIALSNGKYAVFPTSSWVLPEKIDSLNLIFSAIADYLFIRFKLCDNLTIDEKCYILAKRCLTVLYSLLLFADLYSKSYARRILLAEKYLDKFNVIFSPKDIAILRILTRYKLSGNPSALRKLPLDNKSGNVLLFLEDYFKELSMKVLIYEISFLTQHNETLNLDKHRLVTLLNRYRSKASMSFIEGFALAFVQVGRLLMGGDRDKVRVAIYSLLIERLSVGNLLGFLVGRAFARVVNEKEPELRNAIGDIKLLWDSFML